MKLSAKETAQVQQAFIKIKISMDDLVTTCTSAIYSDKQYFQSRFITALRDKEAFNGLDAAGKLKYHKWDWYEATWDLVMNTLREAYVKLDAIIRHDQHLDPDVEALLEMLISKYEICVAHLQDYKTIWKQQILPRQEQQAKAWKPSPFEWSNPYGPTSLAHKLASLEALNNITNTQPILFKTPLFR
jgi:hypothetical protein